MIDLWWWFIEVIWIIIYYYLFRFIYQLCRPWSAENTNIFRMQLQPGQNKTHQWPMKYTGLFYSLWAAKVGLGFALNLQEWNHVFNLRTVTTSYMIWDIYQIQKAWRDCQEVHSEKRVETILREKYGYRTRNSQWDNYSLFSLSSLSSASNTNNNNNSNVHLPNLTEMIFHHFFTVLTIYGFGLTDYAQNQLLLAYLIGAGALIPQYILWFIRQECSIHRNAVKFPLIFACAAMIHIIAVVFYIFRLMIFLYCGWDVIFNGGINWWNLFSMIMGVALILLFFQNLLWCKQMILNGESFAFCNVKHFEISVPTNDKHKEHSSTKVELKGTKLKTKSPLKSKSKTKREED